MRLKQITESLETNYKLNEDAKVTLAQMKSDIKKAKTKLRNKKPSENFGQKEIRKIGDKYLPLQLDYFSDYNTLMNEFVDWCAKVELNEALNSYKYEAEVKDKSGKGIAVIKGKIKAKTEKDAESKIYDILTIDKGYESDNIKKISAKLNEDISVTEHLNESQNRRGRKINESLEDRNEVYEDYFCSAFIRKLTDISYVNNGGILDSAYNNTNIENGKLFIAKYPEIVSDLAKRDVIFSNDTSNMGLVWLGLTAKAFGLV